MLALRIQGIIAPFSLHRKLADDPELDCPPPKDTILPLPGVGRNESMDAGEHSVAARRPDGGLVVVAKHQVVKLLL